MGSYRSPQSAVDDVYLCATGYHAWDIQGSCNEPTDLSEWVSHQQKEEISGAN